MTAAAVHIEITPDEEGRRLDAALGARPEVGSRAAAQRMIDAGRVTVDGRRRSKGHRVHAGNRVVVEAAPPASPVDEGASLAPFAVAYEDRHLIVVDKPAGVVVHPARGHASGTLVQALAGRAAGGDDPWRPGVVHRLDRDTSGLLVVARGEEAHSRLARMIAAREVSREYLALVEGCPPSRSGTIDAPLGRDHRSPERIVVGGRRSRSAVTHFEVRERLAREALLEVRLETGRTHQIRAHLLAIGHPVCGDPQYGTPGRLGLTRQFLHSRRLAFAHPFSGAALDLQSPLPPDLEAALTQAREP